MTATTANKLTGAELLAVFNSLLSEPASAKKDAVIAAGYVNSKGGADFTSYYEAVLEAKGIKAVAVDETELQFSTGEEDYKVVVPVTMYWEFTVTGKAGMTKAEVIDSISVEDTTNGDLDYADFKPKHVLNMDFDDYTVFNEDGEVVYD